MCKYEMDPTSIVEDTERTRFCPQMDKVKPVYTAFNFVEGGGVVITSDTVNGNIFHYKSWKAFVT